jgi:hypothetical protein
MKLHLQPDSTLPNSWIQLPLMPTRNLNSLISLHKRSDSSLHQDLDRVRASVPFRVPALLQPLLFTQNWVSFISWVNFHPFTDVQNVKSHWTDDEYHLACSPGEVSAHTAEEESDQLSQSLTKQLIPYDNLLTHSMKASGNLLQTLHSGRFARL